MEAPGVLLVMGVSGSGNCSPGSPRTVASDPSQPYKPGPGGTSQNSVGG
uniref:IdnK gluconokinase homolog (E. coli) n=1 Tax=Mus musculus TaxID=10090 RepID=A0A286YCG1_MOUSE